MRTAPFGGGELCLPDSEAECLLIYISDPDRDESKILFSEAQKISAAAMAFFPVEDWNRDLSPWAADAVFGDEGFAGGAKATLAALEDAVSALPPSLLSLPRYVCGYSLAGLFALWAMHESRVFSGCAAVSGSFWFPGLMEYVRSSPLSPEAKIYLSLGKKESKSRNRQMRTVGETLIELYDYYTPRCQCTLEWNDGNHFTDPAGRMLKGFAWLQAHADQT